MSGYQDFIKLFRAGSYVSSKDISAKYSLPKALSSVYIVPTFFRGVYYVPTERERAGHFIEKPEEFFFNLFNFVYGRRSWYWALSTAARRYGLEWSSTKLIEIIALGSSKRVAGKRVDIAARTVALGKKSSYRSKILRKMLVSLEVNILLIHPGKKSFFKDVKIDDRIGPIAGKERLRKDLTFFRPRTKNLVLRRLYLRIERESEERKGK